LDAGRAWPLQRQYRQVFSREGRQIAVALKLFFQELDGRANWESPIGSR